jgi:glycosyltransferase involved in cell wall biosynthesis
VDEGKRRAIVFAEYFPPYMSSDRRLFHLVSNLQDWSVSAVITPPLRVLTKRCESRLLPYGRSFAGGEKVRTHGGIAATYLTLPGWLRRMFERTATLPLAYAASIPLLIARAAQLVRQADPDLCVVGHPSFITGVVGVAAAKLNGKPILLDYPDAWTALAAETSGLRNAAATATLKAIEAAVARAADRIVVITDSLARYVRSMGARAPMSIVSNGAELDRFRPTPDRRAAGSDGRPFRVLFAGRLEQWSGVREMTALVDEVVSRACSRVEFHFVGDGGAAVNFQRRLEVRGLGAHCRFHGYQPYWLMPGLIAGCDLALLLFPDTQTTRPSSPVKLFEYMAMGKPVIATGLPGVREVVTDGEAIIVDDLRPAQIADHVMRLMDSPEERERIGHAAQRLVNERFGWRHLAGLFEAEMDRAVAVARVPVPAYSSGAAVVVPSANSASPP